MPFYSIVFKKVSNKIKPPTTATASTHNAKISSSAKSKGNGASSNIAPYAGETLNSKPYRASINNRQDPALRYINHSVFPLPGIRCENRANFRCKYCSSRYAKKDGTATNLRTVTVCPVSSLILLSMSAHRSFTARSVIPILKRNGKEYEYSA